MSKFPHLLPPLFHRIECHSVLMFRKEHGMALYLGMALNFTGRTTNEYHLAPSSLLNVQDAALPLWKRNRVCPVTFKCIVWCACAYMAFHSSMAFYFSERPLNDTLFEHGILFEEVQLSITGDVLLAINSNTNTSVMCINSWITLITKEAKLLHKQLHHPPSTSSLSVGLLTMLPQASVFRRCSTRWSFTANCAGKIQVCVDEGMPVHPTTITVCLDIRLSNARYSQEASRLLLMKLWLGQGIDWRTTAWHCKKENMTITKSLMMNLQCSFLSH